MTGFLGLVNIFLYSELNPYNCVLVRLGEKFNSSLASFVFSLEFTFIERGQRWLSGIPVSKESSRTGDASAAGACRGGSGCGRVVQRGRVAAITVMVCNVLGGTATCQQQGFSV